MHAPRSTGDRAFTNSPKCNHHDFFAYIINMRKNRKIKHGAKYHVMARANRREMVEGWKNGMEEEWSDGMVPIIPLFQHSNTTIGFP